jgi:glycosyltransferase involved in cell wall biosynthesis
MEIFPLISCIMPTYNRRPFIPHAIEYFLRQDYEPRELIVVDDGDDQVANLMPEDARVRYLPLKRRLTVGEKRNLACEQARGEIIAHWDDDDWHAPHRLRYQVEHLRKEKAEVCGIKTLLFYDIVNQQAWRYTHPADRRFWLAGSTLCYRRIFWVHHPFVPINVGEDACFVWSSPQSHMIALPDFTFHVGIIHAGNVSPKKTRSAAWCRIPVETIQWLIKDDANLRCIELDLNGDPSPSLG